MDAKTCPLKDAVCSRLDCMWWADDFEQCIVWKIGWALEEIADHLPIRLAKK